MPRTDSTPPSRRLGPRLQRGIWAGLIAAAVGGHVWLAGLPFPNDAGSATPFTAAPGEGLVLAGPAGGVPLLHFSGAPGAAVEVRFERARLSLATLSLLRSAGLDPPADEGPLEWLAEDGGADARSAISMTLPAAADGRIELFQRADAVGPQPYFELRARDADLSVTLAATTADPFADGAAMRRLVAGGRQLLLPAAVPLSIVVPADAALRLRALPTAGADAATAAAWHWSLGASGDGRSAAPGEARLPVRGAGILAGDGRFRLFACAAPAHGPYGRGAARLLQGECERGPAAPALSARQLIVRPAALEIAFAGNAWIARDGKAVNRGLGERLAGETRLLAMLAVVDTGLLLAAGLPLYRALRRRRTVEEPLVFISYRRDDSIAEAKDIADGLARHFGADRIFIDLEDILPGDRFLQRITERITHCRAMIVVIGPGWLAAARDGQRRLDDPADVVRHEVAEALRLQLGVIPVLVRGAALPRPQDLPAPLRGLLEHSALPVSVTHLREDVARLAAALQPIVADEAEEA